MQRLSNVIQPTSLGFISWPNALIDISWRFIWKYRTIFTYQGATVKQRGREGGRTSIYWSDRHDMRSVDVSTCRRRSTEFL